MEEPAEAMGAEQERIDGPKKKNQKSVKENSTGGADEVEERKDAPPRVTRSLKKEGPEARSRWTRILLRNAQSVEKQIAGMSEPGRLDAEQLKTVDEAKGPDETATGVVSNCGLARAAESPVLNQSATSKICGKNLAAPHQEVKRS